MCQGCTGRVSASDNRYVVGNPSANATVDDLKYDREFAVDGNGTVSPSVCYRRRGRTRGFNFKPVGESTSYNEATMPGVPICHAHCNSACSGVGASACNECSGCTAHDAAEHGVLCWGSGLHGYAGNSSNNVENRDKSGHGCAKHSSAKGTSRVWHWAYVETFDGKPLNDTDGHFIAAFELGNQLAWAASATDKSEFMECKFRGQSSG